MNFLIFWLSFLMIFVKISHGANIVVFNPHFAHSHFNFLAKLADILQDSGHNVTVIIPEIDPNVDVGSKKATVIVREHSINLQDALINDNRDNQDMQWGIGIEALAVRSLWFDFEAHMNAICERLFQDKAFIAKMKAKNFDFGLWENVDYCGYGFLKLIGVEKYAISTPMAFSEDMAQAIGLPGRDIIYPMSHDYHPGMTFTERLFNFFHPIFYRKINHRENAISESLVRKYADPNFSKDETIAQARYIFVNSEEHMDFPRPLTPKIVYIGGITCDVKASSGSLNEDYQQIFDSAQEGVVLVSFGSLAKSSMMPEEYKQAFLATFKKFPKINFIWKYEDENDTIADDLPNVFKRTWVPQKDILAHPKLIAFVTHGGMNSITEAAHYGIPLVAISLFADQHRNAKMLEYRKTAIHLLKADLSQDTLIKAMTTVTQGASGQNYRHRAKTLAKMLATKPLNAKERFVEYMNFAVNFKDEDDFLDMELRNHSFVKFYNLDIFAFSAIVLTVFVIIIYFVLANVFRTLIPLNFVAKKKQS